jgi:hypothetical protein
VWGSACIVPSASRSCRLIPGGRTAGAHWMEGGAGPRAGPDDMERTTFVTPPTLEPFKPRGTGTPYGWPVWRNRKRRWHLEQTAQGPVGLDSQRAVRWRSRFEGLQVFRGGGYYSGCITARALEAAIRLEHSLDTWCTLRGFRTCAHCALDRSSSSCCACSLCSCSSVGQKQVRDRSLADCTSSSCNADGFTS